MLVAYKAGCPCGKGKTKILICPAAMQLPLESIPRINCCYYLR